MFGISRYTLLNIKQIKSKILHTGNYIQYLLISHNRGTCLVVQQLTLHATNAKGQGSIPG